MPTCPECGGKGKWLVNGERTFCKICHGRGALNDLQLTGYQASKMVETQFRLEELADPSPENLRRVAAKREALRKKIAGTPKEHQASSWREWRDPRDEKIYQESLRRGVDITVVAEEFDKRDFERYNLIGAGFVTLLCTTLGLTFQVLMPFGFASIINLGLAFFTGIWFLVLAFKFFRPLSS